MTARLNSPSVTLDTRIEQAIARGETVEEIVAALGVDEVRVGKVVRRMDEAAVCDDVPHDLRRRIEPHHVIGGRAPLAPHGTHAAFNRHKKRGEEPCPLCRVGERRYQADQYLLRTSV